MKTPRVLMGLIATIALFATAPAQAIIWEWSYSGSGNSGSGTLVTNDLIGSSYLITSLSGLWNGTPIIGLDSVGTCCSSPANDNLLFSGSILLDLSGLSFNLGSLHENLYYDSFVSNYKALETSNASSATVGTFTANQVPEPASLALLGLGLAGLGVIRRKNK